MRIESENRPAALDEGPGPPTATGMLMLMLVLVFSLACCPVLLTRVRVISSIPPCKRAIDMDMEGVKKKSVRKGEMEREK